MTLNFKLKTKLNLDLNFLNFLNFRTSSIIANNASSAPAGNENHHRNNSDPFGRTPDPGLYAPLLHNSAEPDDSLHAIIDRLMALPHYLYSDDGQQVTLNITWAVGVVGRERFEPVPLGRRLSLHQDDELRTRGVEWGLSQQISDWLRSGEETLVLPPTHFP